MAEWEDGLVSLYHANCTVSGSSEHKERLQNIDEVMFRTFEKLGRLRNSTKVDESGLPLEFVPPNSVVFNNVQELSAYLIAVYAAKNPIIEVPDLPDAMHVTEAIRDKINRDSLKARWSLELIKAIQNAVAYNMGVMEVRLTADKVNTLTAIDPYNFFYDTTVKPSSLSTDALYAGYTELISLPALYRKLAAVGEPYITSAGMHLLTNIDSIEHLANMGGVASGDFVGAYRYGGFTSKFTATAAGKPPTWNEILTDTFEKNLTTFQRNVLRNRVADGRFELTTYYHRGMPSWLGLPNKTYGAFTGTADNLPVFRMYFLNHTYLIAVEPVIESHGMMPLIVGQVVAGNDDMPLTYAESLSPVQIYSDKLAAARIAALRRALSDRGLYDSSLIDPAQVANPSVTAQIPVNGHSMRELGKSIRDAYMHLPFDTSGVSQLLGALAEVDEYAMRISGNNVQMQGGHLPGNRTQIEAQRVNIMGEGRFRVYSIMLQQTLMTPLKQIIRYNLGDSTVDLTYVDETTGRKQSVMKSEFDRYSKDFVLVDGMMPANKVVSPEAINTLMTAIIQIPELRGVKDLGTMVTMLATAMGFEDFSRIPPPTQQQVAMMQQGALTSSPEGMQPDIPTQTDKQA